jgi:hypothetical protein
VPARAVSPETALPQPTARPTRAAIPAQRCSTTSPARQLAEQDWTTLVATWRLLSRLQVERARHHLLDDAEAFARDADLAEEDLEHHFAARWARVKRRLASETATWWNEHHGPDPRTCPACRVQNLPPEERITVPPPTQRWFS